MLGLFVIFCSFSHTFLGVENPIYTEGRDRQTGRQADRQTADRADINKYIDTQVYKYRHGRTDRPMDR